MKKLPGLGIFLLCLAPAVCLGDPLPEIPTAYGGVVISGSYHTLAVLLITASGLGTEYIVFRILTHRMGVRPLPWLLAFIGVHAISWPLATHSIMALGDSHFLDSIAEAMGAFAFLILIGFEMVVGVVEGIAFGLIFSKFATLRRWIAISIVANLVGFFAGFAATEFIEQWFHQLYH